jgi:hypothetical protein
VIPRSEGYIAARGGRRAMLPPALDARVEAPGELRGRPSTRSTARGGVEVAGGERLRGATSECLPGNALSLRRWEPTSATLPPARREGEGIGREKHQPPSKRRCERGPGSLTSGKRGLSGKPANAASSAIALEEFSAADESAGIASG